ncbi:MAG TPA: C40 family peptidase [Burkholderiales bacterium]
MRKITATVALALGMVTSVPHAAADDMALPEAHSTPSHASAYMERARDIMFYALSLVGIRYRWGGSSPQTGFDCSGLVAHVYRQIAGLVLPRDSYSMAKLGTPVDIEDLRPGDLVFFNTMRRPFSHVGIYLGDKRFVHAPAQGKTVNVVDMTEPYWASRYNGARRFDL